LRRGERWFWHHFLPVETNVWLNLLHKLPIYISTPDRAIWKIEDGKISQVK
jgi:hypothetical protein